MVVEPILNTELGDYFRNEGHVPPELAQRILVLGRESANALWQGRFAPRSSCYFDLPDSCWAVGTGGRTVGRWNERYNSGRYSEVADILRAAMPSWKGDEAVLFCVSKNIIVSTEWQVFLKTWDCFLAMGNDCPIVIAESKSTRGALMFTPLGEIRILS